MVEIGSQPVLWHIMKLCAHYGFRYFIICLGYKTEIVKRHFLSYYHLASDLTLSLGDGGTAVHGSRSEDWLVTLVDTGPVTETGGRLRRVRDYVGDSTFLLTYGDGVGDVNLADLVSFHRRHGKLATLTAVRPPARFGVLELEGDRVAATSRSRSPAKAGSELPQPGAHSQRVRGGHGIPPRRPGHRRHGQRGPAGHVREQHSRHLERPRGGPPSPGEPCAFVVRRGWVAFHGAGAPGPSQVIAEYTSNPEEWGRRNAYPPLSLQRL